MLYTLFKTLILPPIGLFLAILLGLLWWPHPWLGRGLILFSVTILLVLSLPIVATRLMSRLEPYPALNATDLAGSDAQAIVVLGAGRYSDALEYGGDDIGPLTLQRLRYAALLQRRTGLPLYASGGSPESEQPPLARLMKRALERDFRVPVAGIEEHSRTTWENASNSADLLQDLGIFRILLVSHAWHLPRAADTFERAGFAVTPAPTSFATRNDGGSKPVDYLPSSSALYSSYYAIHEFLGRIWYGLKEAL